MSNSNAGSSKRLSPEEIKLRGSLLARNKDLLRLHRELVFTGCLTEEEFWELRRNLLNNQDAALKLKKGLSSSFLADDLKPISEVTGNDVKYVLTPAIIQSIFGQFPTLKRAFSNLVGVGEGRLSEKEFWIEYFKSKFFLTQHKKQQLDKDRSESILDKFYEERLSKNLNEAVNDESPLVSELVDLTMTNEDHVSDYVKYESVSSANDASWAFLRQFNRHSLGVIQTVRSNHSVAKINEDFVRLNDLERKEEPKLATLGISEDNYFGTFNLDTKEACCPSSLVTRNQSAIHVSPSSTNYPFVFNSFQQYKASTDPMTLKSFTLHQTTTDPINYSDLISNSPDLHNIITTGTEILRHFWSSINLPPLSRLAKITRMISIIERIKDQITTKIERVDCPDEFKIATRSLIKAFDIARKRFEELNK